MLELILRGFIEWIYGLVMEAWQYFADVVLDVFSMDFEYLRTYIPVVDDIMQVALAAGWALLIGNLVFQAIRSMAAGLGFEGEDPKLLFTRTFVFAFLLLASPQICAMGLRMTAKVMELLQLPDAADIAFPEESWFGDLAASWLLMCVTGLVLLFKVFKLILEVAERYVVLAFLTITAPLAFGMGGSKSTSDIFTGWCRMYGSMCLLMCTHVIFIKLLLSVMSTVPAGLEVLPWILLVFAMQICVRTQPTDTSEYVTRMKICAESEQNPACLEMIEDNISEIGNGIARDTIRRRFFIVFQYEPRMKARRNTVQGIIERLSEEADTARRYLDLCELEVLEPRYVDNVILELLYDLINKRTGRRVKLPPGVFDMTTAVHGLYV